MMIHVVLVFPEEVMVQEVVADMDIKLFDTTLTVKENKCSLNGIKGTKIDKPYINMYVTLTNTCNASCNFCCNHKNRNKLIDFNFYKFYYIIHEVHRQLNINKLSFTGGEPALNIDLLKNCVKAVKDMDNEIFTIVNTNGSNLMKIAEFAEYFDSIAISRHHYKDDINGEIFDSLTIPHSDTIKKFPYLDKLHLSCMLQKNCIKDAEDIMFYLEHAAKLGISDVGFVSLMPVNEYCKKNFIDFKNIDFDSIENLYISKEWNNENYCRCRNYLYIPKFDESKINVVKMYTRYYVDPSYCTSTLVFDGEYLRKGFNGDIII